MREIKSQMSLFDGSVEYKFPKDKMPIRIIELFGGIGAQLASLKRLEAEHLLTVESYRYCEIDKYAVKSFNAIWGTNYEPSDITKWKGDDLGITETDKYTYLLTYSFPCTR